MSRLGDYTKIKTGKLDANASSENGIYEGHTTNYVKVYVQSDMDLIGEIARVNIDRLENKKIYGKIIQNEI